MITLSQEPILIVDDDPVSLELIGEILADEGYAIELADSPGRHCRESSSPSTG